jgi:hypothetical protein
MIQESMQYGMRLKGLNMEIEMIIIAIDNYSKKIPLPLEGSQISSKLLQQTYEKLMEDRNVIDQTLSENESLKEEIKETSLSVTHYSYVYFFLFLLFLFLLYLLFGNLLVSSGTTRGTGSGSGSMFGGTTSKYNLGI